MKKFSPFRFLSNLRFPWKTEFALKFFTVLNLSFTTQDFWATCACPEKQCALNSLYWIYIFYHSGFLSNMRLPWKIEFTLKFFTVLNILFTFRIFEQLALTLKNRVCPEFIVLNIIFYHSGFLNNLHLPWKKEFALKFSTVLNVFFIIQDFWATCACAENRVYLEIFQANGETATPPPLTPMY